jgi:hypothetical protein
LKDSARVESSNPAWNMASMMDRSLMESRPASKTLFITWMNSVAVVPMLTSEAPFLTFRLASGSEAKFFL